MFTFRQITDPVAGSLTLSALCAALPLVLLFVLLGGFRVKAPKAALLSLGLSMVLAVVGWNMPLGQVLSGTVEGAFYGMFPILWILINALWVYRLTVATPWFEVLGRTIRSVTNDHRILAILIAFGFGALLESVAGFGAPVAIAAAMLMAAGMKPLKAAIVSLVANTAPVAFGAMAAPVVALHGVTGLPIDDLAAMAGRQGLISLIVPLLLIYVVDGRRGFRQTWPIALVAGLVFSLSQFVTSNYLALELTDVVAAVLTVAAVLLMLRFWQPAELVGGDGGEEVRSTRSADADADRLVAAGHAPVAYSSSRSVTEAFAAAATAGAGPISGNAPLERTERPSGRHILMATAPYLIIVAIFSVAMIPAVKAWLTEIGSVTFEWPGLDVTNAAGEPVTATTFHLDHLKATGTLLFIAGLATMALYRVSPREGWHVYREGVYLLRWTIVTVSTMLALSFVMNLSGQTATMGVALAATGGFFAVLSPVIGWIGVALTGSDTSSNALFGQLQVSAAHETGLSPVLMAVSNSTAGALGKMVSLQNLAIASAAVGLEGGESILFRKLLWWSLGLLAVLAGFVFLQSTPILGWMVP
ncbi:L-lactate permease [Pengzhenrongella sicca]|uniref:L-lactate permease n=1 Tax=Pengzhenrongella sicca TaxID=2819238 RepID=A0A8A4ZEJ7_9MICO|nr:L-lactate permease [Pengzhenrongella sicca]QTE29439.1 L-lactate permease [Pengzhenrongella sicca]